MGLLSFSMQAIHRLFGGRRAPRKDTVAFDGDGIVRTLADGRQESIRWTDLRQVAIVTTGDGPFGNDLFWMLTGDAGGCLLPGDADGAETLMTRLQELPGFDNEAALLAMACTGEQRFVCWQDADAEAASPDAVRNDSPPPITTENT